MSIELEVYNYVEDHIKVLNDFADLYVQEIERFIDLLEKALKCGNKILICGNGGSASDSQHFAAEIVGRYKLERKGFPAIALTTDSSIITSVANDYSFENIFARQVEALGDVGDVLVLISTSGTSKNLIRCFEIAKQKCVSIVSLLGKGGGTMKGKSDIEFIVPSFNTPRIQEIHIFLIHTVCELLEKRL